MAVARFSSEDNTMCYVLPIMWMTLYFQHNSANRTESKTTFYRRVRQMAALMSTIALYSALYLI